MILLWALVQGCSCFGLRISDLGCRARVICSCVGFMI